MSASTKPPLGFAFEADPETPAAAGPGPFARAAAALRRRADAWFPDRQILIRGPGNVAALHLSQRAQLLAAAGIVTVLAALTATSIGIVVSCRAELRFAQTTTRLQSELASVEAANARERLAYQKAAEQRDIAIAQADHARDTAITQANHARDAAVAAAQAARDLAVARANAVVAGSNQTLDGLITQTQSTVGQVESVIKSTGLNPDELARQSVTVSAPPVAGLPPPPGATSMLPVIVTPGSAASAGSDANIPVPAGLPENAKARAALLIGNLRHLAALGAVLAQMPLSSPTAQAIVSSGFGMRPDPWTGAPEFHVGIDLPGPIGAPIYATAPGTVVFAGVSTGYGNLITIDHGYGLSTRYSHLDKILVKQGDKISLHQEIGLMGNTGWSTGPHLLYETRVDGQPENPLNFIKVNPYNVQN
jgi:murein DD-endopeptidase MepM/ murein hydrolase activator NlpD